MSGTGPVRALAFSALALLTAAGCTAEGGSPDGEARDGGWAGRVLPRSIEKVDFTLTDTRGEPYSFGAETEGRVALLFFGYTHCPDVCPIHMGNLAAVLQRLPADVRSRIEVVFVTTDPRRDTRERIRTWLDRFDPRFVGLRGPKEKVDSIQVALGLPPSVKEGSGDEYTVGHGANVVAFTPDGKAHLLYPHGTRQEAWARDLPKLVRQGWTAPDG